VVSGAQLRQDCSPVMKQPKAPLCRGSIAVLDDEENMVKILAKVLHLEGYQVTTFTDGRAALDHLAKTPADVLLSDIRMPGMGGREVLRQIGDMGTGCEVIMMTAYGTIDGAIDCVKAGAFDYITKPFKTDELLLTLSKAFEHKRLKEMNSALTDAYNQPAGVGKETTLLGESPAMEKVRSILERVAPSDSPVLLVGESGTGKELAARALHRLSRRSAGRFVAINCASIPENLMESELFGYERGAFTGADRTKVGLLEVADGGTLFMDEVGEMPASLQAKLLRALQEREVTRVGGVANIPVNIRIVSATNRDLARAVREKTFREDLYYRLNVISVEMPPLRERREDIPRLARRFLEGQAVRLGRPALRFSEDVLETLKSLPWRGNVRELENLVERLAILTPTDVITTEALPSEIRQPTPRSSSGDGVTKLALSAQAMVEEEPDFRAARDSFEREYLEALLRRHGGSVAEAARRAGLSRRNMYDKIEKLGITLDLIRREPSDE